MNIEIRIKDINKLSLTDIVGIHERLSWPDSGSDSSIRVELEKRYIKPTPGPHPSMMLAMVWQDGVFAAWVGTRPWPEKFKGEPIIAQTIECFTDQAYRRKGLAKLGLLALISAALLNRNEIVSVYSPAALHLARQCGCKQVILCDT